MVARLTGGTLIPMASCTRHAGRVALLAPLPVPPEALWTLGHARPAQGFAIRDLRVRFKKKRLTFEYPVK